MTTVESALPGNIFKNMRTSYHQAIPKDEQVTPLTSTTTGESSNAKIEDGQNNSLSSPTSSATKQTSKPSWTSTRRQKVAGVMVLLLGAWCVMLPYLGISPSLTERSLRSLNVFKTSGEANTIKMCVNETHLIDEQPSVGALVQCHDKDLEIDDKMCEGWTGADGCLCCHEL